MCVTQPPQKGKTRSGNEGGQISVNVINKTTVSKNAIQKLRMY